MENEQLIKRFFFGEMTEQERFDFEERFVTDAHLFDEIRVFEDELIEKYVREWMNAHEKSIFEKHFLSSENRRERVEFARQLIGKTEERKKAIATGVKKNEVVIGEDISVWNQLAAFLLTPKIAMTGALTLVIAVIGSWFIYQNSNHERPETVRNNSNPRVESSPEVILPQPVGSPVEPDNGNQTDASPDLNKIPKPERTNDEPEKTPTPTDKPNDKTAPNPILALFAGTVRSQGKSSVFSLPKEAKTATLQLNLESVDYKTFRAELTDADGNVLLQRSDLRVRKSIIDFVIPAEKLNRGDYLIKLHGKNASGKYESAADFQFRVMR